MLQTLCKKCVFYLGYSPKDSLLLIQEIKKISLNLFHCLLIFQTYFCGFGCYILSFCAEFMSKLKWQSWILAFHIQVYSFFFFFLHNILNKLIFFFALYSSLNLSVYVALQSFDEEEAHIQLFWLELHFYFFYFNWTWRFKALLLLNRKYFLFCLCLIVNSICFHIQEKCCLYKIHTTVCTTLFCVYLFYAYHLMLHSLHWKGARGFFWVLCIDIF